MYWSRYDAEYIAALARRLCGWSLTAETWCAFDNTASGAAIENACELAASCHVADRDELEVGGDPGVRQRRRG